MLLTQEEFEGSVHSGGNGKLAREKCIELNARITPEV